MGAINDSFHPMRLRPGRANGPRQLSRMAKASSSQLRRHSLARRNACTKHQAASEGLPSWVSPWIVRKWQREWEGHFGDERTWWREGEGCFGRRKTVEKTRGAFQKLENRGFTQHTDQARRHLPGGAAKRDAPHFCMEGLTIIPGNLFSLTRELN